MSAPPSAERAERFRNVTIMSMPAMWPAWPFLPLVRRSKGELECGLLCDLMTLNNTPGFSATVHFGNLFMLPPTLDDFIKLPKEVFDTPDEIYSAGWRVD